MAISVEKLENEPIIITTVHALDQVEKDMRRVARQVVHLIDGLPDERVCYIIDATSLNRLSYTDVLIALGEVGRGSSSFMGNERLATFVAGSHDLLPEAVDSLHQAQYGEIRICLLPTRDRALAAARAHLAGDSDPSCTPPA